MSVLIIDYGMGNLGSVCRAFEECGADVFISEDPESIKNASHIVLPGVGAFGDGMTNLKNKGWDIAIRDATFGEKIPFLGICLGMQLMADRGEESGDDKGLGLIAGEVVRFVPKNDAERVPHVGWNEIYPKNDHPLFLNIVKGSDVYFVHSYHFKAKNSENILATTPYCGEFISAVGSENIFGTQFHPEKSSRTGFQILKNFLNLSC